MPKGHQRTKDQLRISQPRSKRRLSRERQICRAAFPWGHLEEAAKTEKWSKASQGKGYKTSFRLATGGKHKKIHIL